MLIADTSSTATNYDLLYTPASDGYVYIAVHGTNPQVIVYETAYGSTKINTVETEIDAVDDRVDHTQQIMPKELYDFSLLDLFKDLESAYIDDFSERDSMVDEDHPYTVTGGTATLPTITDGVGATRTGESGVSALFYAKTFIAFPYICMIGRVTGAAQVIKLYNDASIAIGTTGSISYNGVTYGGIHYNAQYCLWYVMPEGVIIIDDTGVITRVPYAYTQGKPMQIALGFGANVGRLFGYGSFVEFVKMPLTPLDFTRCVAYNRLGNENNTYVKAAVRFTHDVWNNGQSSSVYYVPEDNPSMTLATGISNNPCIKCVVDYDEDAGYRTEIGITPVRKGSLHNRLGGLQRFKASADYYMASADNASGEYYTYIFQFHNAGFTPPQQWATDPPPLTVRIAPNGHLIAAVTYVTNGAVPASDNSRTLDEYDLGVFEMDKWMHLEVEARIGWRNVLAPQLIIRVNGQERLNIQTPIGFNIVSSNGYVNTHLGLYCPQWHSATYSNMHREILITNIRWEGTQDIN